MRYQVLTASLLFAATSFLSAQSQPSFELKRDPYKLYNEQVVAEGDFNHDGKPDLVIGGDSISVQLGNGDGTFQAPSVAGVLPIAYDRVVELAVADVNNDGNPDLVALGVQGTVNIFLGDGTGKFATSWLQGTASYPESATVGDFNGDGLLDLAVGDINGGIELFLNQGGKSFLYEKTVQVGSGVVPQIVRVRAADVDANGTADLAVLTTFGAYALWGDGHAGFKMAELGTYAATADLNVGDLNQDGRADILVSFNCGGAEPYPSKTPYYPCVGIDAYYGQANQTTIRKTAVQDTGVSAFKPWAVDINGDGIADLVSGTRDHNGQEGGLFVWLGRADGTFNPTALRYISTSNGSNDVTPGDFNRDGMMDFADDSGEFYINGANRGACNVSQVNQTVTVCAPVDGTYAPSTFTVHANVYDKTPVTGLQLYVDYKEVFSQAVTRFDISQTLGLGRHLLVTKGWDASGLNFISSRTITVFDGTPGAACAAALGGASLCLPANATSHSPVHILGNAWPSEANGSAVPTAAQLYIDNQLVINDDGCAQGYCEGGSSYVDTYQNLSAGSHYLVFKVFDASGTIFAASKQITVD